MRYQPVENRKANSGRKCKITLDLIESICKLIAIAVPVKDATQAVGISERSFYDYIRIGEDHSRSSNSRLRSDLYSQFFSATKKAQAQNKAKLLEIIYTAAKKKYPNSWTAAAWLLEREYPSEFGKRMEFPIVENKVLIALSEKGRDLIQSPVIIPTEIKQLGIGNNDHSTTAMKRVNSKVDNSVTVKESTVTDRDSNEGEL